jgi:neopullulanase
MITVSSPRGESVSRSPRFLVCLAIFSLLIAAPALLSASPPQVSSAPEVIKVEPPNWWIGISPELLLLLSGHNLEATHVSCNLPTVRVMRTQATSGGDYLFVWLKIVPSTRSGTAVCRITTPTEPTSFELPLATRVATQGKFQALAGRKTPPADEHELRTTRERLPQLKKQGMTVLRLAPLTQRDADPDAMDHGVVDFYTLDPRRGSLQDLQDAVASAHEQQMKVALDLELIHISSHHPWAAKPPLAEWLGAPLGNAANLLKRSASSSGSGRILDTENPLVALYLLQNAIWWTESAGVDEIRVTSDPNTTSQFWATWRAQLQRIYPHLAITLESPDRR